MPEGSFWSNENQPTLEQTKISIPADAQIDYKANQKIEFFIDPQSANFIDPRATTLKMKVQIKLPEAYSDSETSAFQRLQLDAECGANILCKDWRAYTGDRSVLLEEVLDANVLCSVRYDYETNDSYKHKRSLTEGCTEHDSSTRSGTSGGIKSQYNALKVNPYFAGVEDQAQTTPEDDFDNDMFIPAIVELPIQMGLFRQNRLLPLAQLGGIRLECQLCDNKTAIRRLDPLNRHRDLMSCPSFHGKDVAGTDISDGDTAITELFFNVSPGNIVSVENSPFVCGDIIELLQTSTYPGSVDKCVFTPPARVQGVEYDGTNDLLKLTIESATATGDGVSGDSVAYSVASSFSGFEPEFVVSDCELIISKVEPPPQNVAKMNAMMKESGKMVYDFLAYTNYKASQLKENRVANIRLPISNSRCKSVICVPVDASVYTQAQVLETNDTYRIIHPNDGYRQVELRSNRPGLEGISDGCTSYSWVYDNKQNPSVPIDVSKISSRTSISAQHIVEVEKGLSMGHIEPLSLLNFNKNFVICRALAIQDGVYSAVGKGDFNLQVNYQESTVPTKDKLWHCFVAHIRRVQISSGGVSLEI
jgi:hypothetical protein